MSSAPLSRQDSGGQLKSNKSSRTNLSEVSADTGIIEDVDNKVNRLSRIIFLVCLHCGFVYVL